MTALPVLPARDISVITSNPSSEVEVLMYSGRRNPHLSLAEWLKDEKMGLVLKNISAKLTRESSNGFLNDALTDPAFPRLGYQGVKIIDREGLVFPKGAIVYLGKSAQGYPVRLQDQVHFVWDQDAQNISEMIHHFAIQSLK